MKVYIIYEYDCAVLGVFSTRALAEEYNAKFEKEYSHNSWFIEEYVIDSPYVFTKSKSSTK